jgi:hypothetical protein
MGKLTSNDMLALMLYIEQRKENSEQEMAGLEVLEGNGRKKEGKGGERG